MAIARAVGVAAAVVLTGAAVLGVSRAVFTAITENTGSQVTAGTVELVDDDSGMAMFEVSGMLPGDTEVARIEVSYQGTVSDPAPVRLYSGGYNDSGTFASHLHLTVEEGRGGAFADCSAEGGFATTSTLLDGVSIAVFDSTHSDYASGVGEWSPSSPPDSRSYRFTLTLDPDAPNSQQGASVTDLAFVWETRSS